MRTEVYLVLQLLLTPAFGGPLHAKKPKDLPGYDPTDPIDLTDPSPCRPHRGTKQCNGANSGWHYNWKFRFCYLNDKAHCGVQPNYFPTCEACNQKCNVSVCAQETTTKAPRQSPKVLPFGR
ncbi:uncharacterized protein LOC142591298 [Dermacentor variabilis]|uniref:uncharacterized protein LOC142591298 n=1 Tax=Dermacentor variabilis TaxID=34621 RepID=UPI003F5C5AE1